MARAQFAVRLSNQRGDVIGQRALRDERLDLRRGTVECGWVGRSGLCGGGHNRLGETVRAHKAAIARISHQLFGTGFEGAESGDCGPTLSP